MTTGDEHGFQEEVVLPSFPPVEELTVTTNGHFFGFRQEDDEKIRFVWDGIAGEPFDQLVAMRDGTTEFWSGKREHVAYIGLRGGRSFVGRDEREDPPFEAPTRSVPPVFSPDGAHLVYGAQVEGVYRLIRDGQPVSEAALAPIEAVSARMAIV